MTPNEAGEVLVLMQATWPRLAQDDVAARLWVEDLMGLDPVVALKTFRRLRDSEKLAPSWALFIEHYAVLGRIPIREQVALEGPQGKPSMTWREGQDYQEGVLRAAREARVMDRIKNRLPYDGPASIERDALTPTLTYDEIYGGEPRATPGGSVE